MSVSSSIFRSGRIATLVPHVVALEVIVIIWEVTVRVNVIAEVVRLKVIHVVVSIRVVVVERVNMVRVRCWPLVVVVVAKVTVVVTTVMMSIVVLLMNWDDLVMLNNDIVHRLVLDHDFVLWLVHRGWMARLDNVVAILVLIMPVMLGNWR